MSKSKKKEGFESFVEYLLDAGAMKAKRIMETMDDELYMKYYSQMLEYGMPKRQRVEQESKQDTVHKIVINWDGEALPNRSTTASLESGESPEGSPKV
jgi:hypothetical protein